MSTPALVVPREQSLGLIGWMASTDHKSLGKRMIGASILFFVVGGIMALIMRAQLGQPDQQIVSPETYNALFTMHGSTMIYLFVVPLALALGVYLVPLQCGAAEIAGPRVALLGFWLYLAGGLILELGWATNGGPGRATWIAVAPLSEMQRTPGSGQDLWILGVIIVSIGQWLSALCIIATAMRKRAPGMTLMRMAPFTWLMVGTTLMMVFAWPVLVVTLALLEWDRKNGGIFFAAGHPAGPIAYQQLFWFYGHPVVYVMFFPFVGCVAEVFSAFSGRRMFGYKFFVFGSVLLFAAGSSMVWGHHLLTSGRVDIKFFSFNTHGLILAAGIEYFDLLGTLWRGRIRFTTAFLFACGFMWQFLIGGLTGIWTAAPTLDYHVNNSYLIVAHFHYTIFAGSLFAAFAGMYYWWPKFFGVLLSERLGKVHFVLLTIGTNLTFAPMIALGQEGMTRRISTYPAANGWGTLNLLESAGAGIIALAILVFLINVWVSHRAPRVVLPNNPWQGNSLEWATTCPPPRHNFDGLPPIRSYAPMMDMREEAEDRGLPVEEVRPELVTEQGAAT